MEIRVAPEDDVEVRQIRLTNQSDSPRRLTLTSYAELVLGDQRNDRRHPAFNKLFIESEYDDEHGALLFRRRPRAADEDPIYLAHTVVFKGDIEHVGNYDTDRARFIGRLKTVHAPLAMSGEGVSLSATTGDILDPIMAIGRQVELGAHATIELAFITTAGRTRYDVLDQVRRYHGWEAIARVAIQAQAQAEMELRQLALDSETLACMQQMLSALIYPARGLRADVETLAANRLGQPGLWPHAISGDYPILLVRIDDDDGLPLLRDALRAHHYWRNRNLRISLVILNQESTGYAQELQGSVSRFLNRNGHSEWLNRRGGIFVLRADDLDVQATTLIETSARVVLDQDGGSLSDQLAKLNHRPSTLPRFAPSDPRRPELSVPPLARPKNLEFDNGVGGFSPDGCEYVIYLEDGRPTPAPWSNVIANPDFGFLMTESGSSFTWAINSGENRLTPWSNDPVVDPSGESLYLRDEETGDVWSPTVLPAGDGSPVLVRHGVGYSIYTHHSPGLKEEMRAFAPIDAPLKIVTLRLENTSERARRITATYYAEWVLGVNRDEMQQYVVPAYDDETGALLARNAYNTEFSQRIAFLASSEPPHSLTTDRTEFLGRHGRRRLPAGLKRIGLEGAVEAGVDPCAAYQVHLDLESGEVAEVHFLLGQGENWDAVHELVVRYRDPARIMQSWQEMTAHWDDLLGTIQVETPEPAMDLLLNRWLPYQNLSCRVWGRSAFYQSSGAYGFRDQLQDVMALVYSRPDLAREQILRAAAHQFEAGDVLHWWHPPSGRGVRTRITDDLLWLPYVSAYYVSVTGDHTILDEELPFLVGKPLDPDEEERYGEYDATDKRYTLYTHCLRAIDRGTTSGPHGLPLIGAGDWNDGMNRVGIGGRGESVWLAWFLSETLTRFAALCDGKEDERAERYRREARRLRETVDIEAWDGAWYLRGFYDDGTPLGSSQNRECSIDAIAQSWAVFAAEESNKRVLQAMQSVAEHLVDKEKGLIRLFTPPFDRTSHDPGYIKGYPPGVRENGGQYTHAALWSVWAFAELGDGDRAVELFQLINPILHGNSPEKTAQYCVEPYVVAADIYDAPAHPGRGGWTWYTGSAGWMYRLGIEGILGMQRQGNRLSFQPHVPARWQGFHVTLRHGDACYRIRVEKGKDRGVSNRVCKRIDDRKKTFPSVSESRAPLRLATRRA
jgi:cyclic beta-1,2-glucan synthetase